MDLPVDLPVAVIMIGMLAVLLFLNHAVPILKGNISKKKLPPQPKGAWPVIGHLPLLRGPLELPSVMLANLADKYGPIFIIKMGVHRYVIISSWELAKECFTTNDKILANRPNSLKSEVLGYDGAMLGVSPYGQYWRQIRKIATLELLSNHRLQMLKHVRESEVQTGMEDIYQLWEMTNKDDGKGIVLNIHHWFANVTLNIIFKIIFGRRYVSSTTSQEDGGHSDPWRQALSDYFKLYGTSVVSDAIPFLRRLDLGGYEKAMKETAQKLDVVLQRWLEEHKRKRTSGTKVKGEEADFMDVMLSILDDAEEFSSVDTDTINKATCLAFILAASHSTESALTWALALLLSNQNKLKKARDELDTIIGKERMVQESDMKNLVYVHALVKESLRLGPEASLTMPHESTADCTIGGYHIPKGTKLFVNFWKIHRDPSVWSDPFEFKPERFLTTHKDFDVRGQNFELLPFSSGRRMCPGVSFALQVIELALSSLIHGFDISIPLGKKLNLDSESATTNLEVILSPRLPAHLYK